MKLSKDTISILKSFMGINTGLVVQPGNEIMIESEMRNIFGRATVDENFTKGFAIYELPSFISTLELFEDADLEFEDEYVSIKSGRNTCEYYYADEECIANGDWIDIKDDQYVLEFYLGGDDLSNIKKASVIMSLDLIKFTNNDGEIVCSLVESEVSNKNSYSIPVGKCDKDADFTIMLSTDMFKLYQGNYKCRVTSMQGPDGMVVVMSAENEDTDVKYLIAMDARSEIK